MKKIALFLLVVLSGNVASALPKLQLDVSPGVYDPVTDTTIATSNPFTLRALMSSSFDASRTFYLSAGIVPGTSDPNFGSFSVNGTTYSSSSGMQYGTPPVDSAVKDLGAHSVYPTWYAEIAFNLVPVQTTGAINVEDDSLSSGSLYYVDFTVNITGLFGQPNSPYAVHFDLYTYDEGGNKIFAFAPFSHDAESSHGITIETPPTPSPVPDGGLTLSFLATAALGMMGLRRMLA